MKKGDSKSTEEKPKIIRGVEAISRIAIREMLKKELALRVGRVETEEGGSAEPYVILELMLNGEAIGKRFCISAEIDWKTDHGHGGGRYPAGVRIKVD